MLRSSTRSTQFGTSLASSAGVSRDKTARGFTLIEVMVVVLIIGMVAATIVLSVGVTGRDRELEKESERAFALLNYAREKAELETHEFGLFCDERGYEFLTYDPRKSIWRSVDEDDALRARPLPEGLKLRLLVEGRPIVLKRPEPKKARDKDEEDKDRVPHVMIFSNGDLTPFRLTLEREAASRSITLASNEQGQIEAEPLQEAK